MRVFGALMIGLALAGCGAAQGETIMRVALLAPFEGRYREVGYNALYAARLAIQDFGGAKVELLPIDDGGTGQSAADRARALAGDPVVRVVIALGYAATGNDAQQAFGEKPALIVGQWGARPETDHTFLLASRELERRLTAPPRFEVTEAARLEGAMAGGEVFGLEQFSRLSASAQDMLVVSSASLPDAAFRERYRGSGPFAPEPGLLATLTYDAVGMALAAMRQPDARTALATMTYEGLNGTIRFQDGYWADAPIHCYRHEAGGGLTPVNCPVE